MAIRLNFVVEGQTEEAFVKQILSPYLAGFEVWVQARCVLTSRRRNIKYRGGVGSSRHYCCPILRNSIRSLIAALE